MAFENGKNWHYVKNGEAAGPVQGEEMRRLVIDGQVRRETLIWSPGLANWVEAGSYPDLFEGLEPVPPPLPMSGGMVAAGGTMQTAPAAHGIANPGHNMATSGYDLAGAPGAATTAAASSSGLFSGSSYAGGSYAGEAAVAAAPTVRYAGFWIRVVAYVIDAIIISGLVYAVTTYTNLTAYPRAYVANLIPTAVTDNWEALLLQQRVVGFDRADMLNYASQSAVSIVITFVYFVILQAILQATIGKLIVGIRLRTSRGGNVGVFRALWRYLMTYISTLILGIGFLLAGWTREKTALHDLLAGTRVVYRRS